LETAVAQMLNLVLPLVPLFTSLGIDFVTDIAPALLDSYGIAE
jgi:hypothetical protein